MRYVLDTAPWINGVKQPETLPRKIREVLEAPGEVFGLPDICLLEASVLARKRRVDWGMHFLGMAGAGLGREPRSATTR